MVKTEKLWAGDFLLALACAGSDADFIWRKRDMVFLTHSRQFIHFLWTGPGDLELTV